MEELKIMPRSKKSLRSGSFIIEGLQVSSLSFVNGVYNVQQRYTVSLRAISFLIRVSESLLALFGMVFGRYKAKTLSLSVSWGVEFPRSGFRVNEFGLDHNTIQSSHNDLSPSIQCSRL